MEPDTSNILMPVTVKKTEKIFETLTQKEPPTTVQQQQVLRSEIPSGMCAKLRTAAASNNRVHPTRLLYYCLFAPRRYIFVLRTHPVRGESHNPRNATGEVATQDKYKMKAPLASVCLDLKRKLLF